MRWSKIVVNSFGKSTDVKKADAVVFGVRLRPRHLRAGQPRVRDDRSSRLRSGQDRPLEHQNPDDVNGGINHFGSPFNFPEEFVTVYRLHPLVPDLIEYRELKDAEPDRSDKVPVIDTLPRQGDRGDARARPGQLGAQHGPAAAGRC